MIPRRVFLRDGSLAVVGLSMVPGFLARTLHAAGPMATRKTLVILFQRGGADGLNMVIPFGEPAYYDYRPSIAIGPPGKEESAIDLDGKFGLHPALAALAPLYKAKQLGIINAVGTPDTGNRSHFQAQDFMESAAPGDKSVSSGWLNRYLQQMPDPEHKALRATAIGPTLPKALRGPAAAMALGTLNQLDAVGGDMYQSMYSADTNALITGTANGLFDAVKQVKSAKLEQYTPANGATYGNAAPGPALMQVAQLIKSDVGLQIAFIDVNGWDTHGAQNDRMPPLMRALGQSLAAFNTDLGKRMEDVVVLTMSEFGRTARENGNGGTDHGHANLMFVMGGPVKGGKIFGKWPGLNREHLNEDRDLVLTTDFRDVLAELLVSHLGCTKPNEIFPKFSVSASRFHGLL
jgi:uncharacterized protein (DUF1501 family)